MYSHYLDTFICVADIGSFSRAGEEMFISATAVMKQINQMEVKLGVQLFERTSKGLVLTPAGKSYYRDAKFMIRYAKEAQSRAVKAMKNGEMEIRVGVSALAPTGLLVELWAHSRWATMQRPDALPLRLLLQKSMPSKK